MECAEQHWQRDACICMFIYMCVCVCVWCVCVVCVCVCVCVCERCALEEKAVCAAITISALYA